VVEERCIGVGEFFRETATLANFRRVRRLTIEKRRCQKIIFRSGSSKFGTRFASAKSFFSLASLAP